MKRQPRRPAAIDTLAGVLADGGARPTRRRRSTAAEIDTLAHLAKAGTGAEFPAGARQRPRLSRSLVARRHRRAARLAGIRDERAALHRPPSVGRRGAREKSRSRHARAVADALRAEGRLALRPARAGHGAPPARALGDAASLARRRRPVRQSRHPQRFASFDPRRRPPARAKSAGAITRDILDELLATCGRGRAIDLRDRALLLLAFGSGGRRRSEIVRLRVDDLEERALVPADPEAPEGPTLPVLAVRLRRTKTSSADAGESALIVGRPVDALRAWLEFSKIDSGPVFRRIDKWGQIGIDRARSAERQRHHQKPLRRRRPRSGAIFGAWIALRLSHPGRARRGFASRGHAAVAAPVRAAGVALLQ